MLLVTNDTLHHDLNVPYARDEIKRFDQGYANRIKEHPNLLATNVMEEVKTTRRLKRKLPSVSYCNLYSIHHWTCVLQGFHKLYY